MNCKLFIVLTPLLLVLAATYACAQADPEQADLQTLRAAHVGTDAPALLLFFAKRTPDEAALARVHRLVRELGEPSYRTRERACRELVGFGRIALPALQQAVSSRDLEVSSRAGECIKEIEAAEDNGVACAAARRLALLKPPAAAGVLLKFIPFADSTLVREHTIDALAALAADGGEAARTLVRALGEAQPQRRAAAAEVLARTGTAKDFVRLLHDPDPAVRLPVALVLVQAKDRAAVPVLIDLLTELPREQTWQVRDVLRCLAGERAPPAPAEESPAARQKDRAAWSAWWKANGATVELAKLQRQGGVIGYTLVVLIDAGKVLQVDSAGRTQWQVDGLQTPLDAQVLPGERVLVAENGAGRVTERNAAGHVLWQRAFTEPVMAQRLPNGNTFVATQTGFHEFDPSGNEVLDLPVPSLVYKAVKLPNGDIGYISGDEHFVRLNSAGRPIASFAAHVDYYGGRVDVLSNGHVVVPEANNGRVVEFDATGKIVWEVKLSGQPVAASRLGNGNTLVTFFGWHRGVEIDRQGREVWEYKADSRVTRLIRRRPHDPPCP